jgi:arylsulfatase A-like enzyme
MRNHSPASVRLRPNVPDTERITTRARLGLAGAYAQIENLDWNIGRIRAALARLNLADTTHIVFFSDHGDMHGSHGQFLKTSPWEEAVRVPFVIAGTVPFYGLRGGSAPAPINHVDIAPTTLGLCGIDAPREMPGTDYSGYRIPGRPIQNEPDSAFMQLVKPTMHADSTDRPWRGIVTRDRWKYVVLEGQPWLLFNLNEDPYELVNLAHNSRYHAERRRLQEHLRDWIARTGDHFRLPE